MLAPWELLLLRNIPRDGQGGDGPSGGPSGDGPGSDGPGGEGDGGDEAGDSGDEGGDDAPTDTGRDAPVGMIGGGPNAAPGIGPGSMSEAAANIAGTSGGPEGAMANAAATGDPGIMGAVAGMVGADSGRSASSMGTTEGASVAPSVSPAVSTSSIASVAAGLAPPGTTVGVTDALGNTSIGGFGVSGITGGVSGANVSGGLGALGGLGGLGTGSSSPGITGVGGLSGVAELGDTGPQGFAASESGFAPSGTATDVSNGLAAVGMAANEAAYSGDMGNVSSLASAAATPAEGLSDIGLADPSGFGTGFTGLGTGSVSISPSVEAAVQAVSSFGAQNIGSYSGMPGLSTPASSVTTPTGMQAATVGYAGTPGITSISSTDLSNQLSGMAQPSAQSAIGVSSPSVSSYGFSGANLGSVQGLTGTTSISGPSSLATAASVPSSSTSVSPSTSSVSRSASSISAEDAPQEQTGIMGLLGNPAVSTALNLGIAAVSPQLGLANMGVLGLTGTAIPGQMASVFSGQGLQTGGGLMGLMGGSGPSFGSGTSNAGVAEGYGGGGGDIAPTIWTMSNEAKQGSEVLSPAPTRAPAPIRYNIADFIAPAPQQGYRPLVI